MATSFAKRQRERSRQEQQKEKEIKRQARRAEPKPAKSTTPGEDPDIAGIIPGPQPVVEDDY